MDQHRLVLWNAESLGTNGFAGTIYLENSEQFCAINGQQLKVVYNRTVDTTSAENTANTVIYKDGLLVNLATAAITLSDDHLSAIITLPNATANTDSAAYVVTIKDVEAKDDSSMLLPLFSIPVTVKDTTNATVSTISALTNTDTLKTFKVTFSEPIVSGVIKIDGTSYGSAATFLADATNKSSNKVTLTGLSLDANVSHTLEVVNLQDTAGNVADTYTQTFSVTKDAVAPTIQSLVAKSDSQIEVTFSKAMDVSTVEAVNAGVANLAVKTESLSNVSDFSVKQKSGDDSDMVFDISIADSSLYDTSSSRTITVVFNDGILDSLGNSIVNNTTNSVVLTKDTVKPTLSSVTYTRVDNLVTKVTATYSENVKTWLAPVVINKDGIQEASDFLDVGVVDNNKITYTVKTPANLTGLYSLVFQSGTVSDMAATANNNSAVTKVIDFGSGLTATVPLILVSAVNNTTTSGGINSNVITVVFPKPVKGGAVIGSATTGSNYTLDGMSLDGAIISLDGLKTTATIKVPAGTIAANNTGATFTIRNIQSTSDDRYATYNYLAGLNVLDDTRPELKSAQIVSNTMFLTFGEVMTLPTGDLITSLQVTCGSKIMLPGDFTETYSLVAGNNKIIQVNLTPVGPNWDNTKTISIKTKSGSLFTDVAGNGLKSDVSVTATK